MSHKLKAATLALAAIFAMSALGASGAQANFKSNKSHTIIHGVQETSLKFTAGAGVGAISCSTVTFSGTSGAFEIEALVVGVTITGCEDSLGRKVHIDNKSLTYTFTNDGVIHVTGSMSATITASTLCTITVSAQTNAGSTSDNLGGTNGIRSTVNANSVKSTISGGFFSCGTSATESSTGTITGTVLTKGEGTEGSAAEISIE